MNFNWIKGKDYSFNSLLLMDTWMLKCIINGGGEKYRLALAIGLKNHPSVQWFIETKCPEYKELLTKIVQLAPEKVTKEELNDACEYVLETNETFIVYLYPEIMDEVCGYIKYWDEEKLLELADFHDKTVLDIGSGTGRLTFVASKYAKMVYSMEPGERMRSFLRDKVKNEKIRNVKVLDGFIEDIPYEDSTFDIVMSAHVVGDDYDHEIKEMERVTKNGGYIIDCMGEDDRKRKGPDAELLRHGFQYFYYKSKLDGDVYRYIKKVVK